MVKLTIVSGGFRVERNIYKKNLLHVLRELMPNGLIHNDCIFHVGGRRVDLSKFCINREFSDDVSILISPKGIVETIAISLIVSLAVSSLLAPDVPVSSTSQGVKESPNNSLFGQTNQIRLDEQEPNIYGLVTSYPDIVTREGGAWIYINNQKIIKEVFLIGTGSYEINSPARYELTPLDDIEGSTYETYQPGDLVPVVQGQFNSEFIDGQALPGPNGDDIVQGVTAITNNGGIALTVNTEGELFAGSVTSTPEWDEIYSYTGETGSAVVNFVYEVLILNSGVSPPVCEPQQRSFSGFITMSKTSPTNYEVTVGIVNPDESDCNIGPDKYTSFLQVTQLLGAEVTVKIPIITNEMQLSFDFRSGLRGSVRIRTEISGDGGSVNPIVNTYVYTADTSRQIFFSEIIPIDFTGNLSVKMFRTNSEKEDGSDRVQVSQVATNEYRYDVDYGNRTMLTTERKATEQALKFSESKINIDITRKTITYDRGTGEVDYNLSSSRRFSDALLHEYVVMNEQSSSDLPLDDMYEIDSRIGNLGLFDATFDNKEQSLKEKLSLIANVARCVITYTGQGYEIYRNEKSLPSGQFDSRNILEDSPEEVSYKGATKNSSNGVKLKWKNPDGNKVDYIYYIIEGANATRCVSQGGGLFLPPLPTIPYEVDLFGSYNDEQAVNRAELECLSLIYLQKTLRITSLVDGENFNRGQVVKHCDYYDDDVDSGEIKSSAGDLHESYSEFKINPGFYRVSYTDMFGSMYGPVDCEIISENMFIAIMPESYVADGFNIQSGSRFIISTQEEHDSNLYTIIDKVPNSDGSVSFDLLQYSEEIYPEEL